MNRFLDCLRDMDGPSLIVDEHMMADVLWFRQFLPTFNGKAIIKSGDRVMIIEADSCLKGGGAMNGRAAYMYAYPGKMHVSIHITQLEAINCLIAIRALVNDSCNGKIVQVHCYNLAVIHSFHNNKSKDRVLNAVARAIWIFAARQDNEFRFNHIPGVDMHKADLLSRAYTSPDLYIKAQNMIAHDNLNRVYVKSSMLDFNKYFRFLPEPGLSRLFCKAEQCQYLPIRPSTWANNMVIFRRFVVFLDPFNISFRAINDELICAFLSILLKG